MIRYTITPKGRQLLESCRHAEDAPPTCTQRREENMQPEDFVWFDQTALRRQEPLALVARAVAILDALGDAAREHDEDARGAAIEGLSMAISRMAAAGDHESVGWLLSGLEALLPAGVRCRLPG